MTARDAELPPGWLTRDLEQAALRVARWKETDRQWSLAIRIALARQLVAPEDMAVVPVTPTVEMENACIRASMAYLALHALKSIWPWHNRRHVRGNIRACYTAMVRAGDTP